MKKFLEEKGVVSLEILFSIIIILGIIFLGIILCVKINAETKRINQNAEASRIATNILENMNSKTYSEFEEYISELSMVGMTKKIVDKAQYISVSGDYVQDKFFNTEIPKGYDVEVNIGTSGENFNESSEVEILIKYLVAGSEEKFELSTVLEHDKIGECNRPIISEDYFNDINISLDDYDIIPIKYSYDKKAYITTTISDTEWYNYSAKVWAKVLIFLKDGDDLQSQFIDEYGTVKNSINYNNSEVSINNYIYIWIPNFTISDEISYFRYKSTKNIIKQDFLYVDSKYLHINRIAEEVKDISEDCNFDGKYGVWRKLGDEDDIYYMNFNLTKYAPINLYY